MERKELLEWRPAHTDDPEYSMPEGPPLINTSHPSAKHLGVALESGGTVSKER